MTTKKWWKGLYEGNKLLSTLKPNETMIVFDTETTGLDPINNHIIQISAIKYKVEEDYLLNEVDRLNLYINPQYKLPKKIVEITNIEDSFLKTQPIESQQFPIIKDFFKGINIVCGHNVSFDIKMLTSLGMRHNEKFTFTPLDTLAMARELYHKSETTSHKLGDLVKYFGLEEGLTFHNSMDDVIATTRILRQFIDDYLKLAKEEPKEVIKTKVVNCWQFKGFKGMQRLYVKVKHEGRLLWVNQRRPYEWGEKDQGSLEMFDMEDIQNQVLKLYNCKDLEELSRVSQSIYAK